MAKIGIYVPDDRMTDIERWRNRLNFSRLFMDAFDRALVAESSIESVKGKEMKELVARLKKQSEGDTEQAWKRGAKEGRDWAVKYAYFSHLRNIAEERITFDAEEDVVRFLRHHYEQCGYVKTPDDAYDDYLSERFFDNEASKTGFNRGFVEAVKKVWEGIEPAFN